MCYTYLSKKVDTQEVQNDNKDREDGDPYRWRDWRIPKLQNGRCSAHIRWYYYRHRVPC
jgi:hypothetical protein